MDSYFHFNTSYPNQYFPEAKQSYGAQYDDSCDAYFDNNHYGKQDFSFLPVIGSPLDATRVCTDATDGSDATPFNFQGFASNITYHNNTTTNQNVTMGNLFGHFNSADLFGQQQSKPTFTTVLGANTGISLSTQLTFTQGRVEADESEDEVEHLVPKKNVQSEPLKSVADDKFFDEEKEETLMKYASQYKCDWKKIAKKFNNKKLTPHFLKNKYKELSAGPSQRRIKFNHREDLMIAKYFEKYGSNWGQMAVHFNGRNGIMLKNRYYSFIRKRDLLEVLLQEVREIESNNCEVDNLNTPEAERYTECMDMKKNGDYEYSSTNNETVDQGGNYDDLSEESPCESVIQSALIYPTEEESNEVVDEAKEVEILKAKVKSLQALYLKTKNELDKIKKSQ